MPDTQHPISFPPPTGHGRLWRSAALRLAGLCLGGALFPLYADFIKATELLADIPGAEIVWMLAETLRPHQPWLAAWASALYFLRFFVGQRRPTAESP
jgi:hypothetical protein